MMMKSRKQRIMDFFCVIFFFFRDWSISIGGVGRSKMGGESLDFGPSQRSLNFELAKGGGSSYL